MAPLEICPRCKHYRRAGEESCPFCGTQTASAHVATLVAGAVLTAGLASACSPDRRREQPAVYGPPPAEQREPAQTDETPPPSEGAEVDAAAAPQAQTLSAEPAEPERQREQPAVYGPPPRDRPEPEAPRRNK